ncbi:hypothetical protein L228DRAFT_251540 [Xylona heveae TC161]|uniref:Secreted protein n=1 Tax=Xylona heveae (strain CBS 132557 / TC161) TaxID=1328760 RepID=A0A164ZEE3_XYLHT|nr:hypothetical protein L228DRAFT_251540 [Xylona heveae TC161]KZF18995.1 hypothetical protein L228DRAFT_251540 [Xylona heveae TC161]
MIGPVHACLPMLLGSMLLPAYHAPYLGADSGALSRVRRDTMQPPGQNLGLVWGQSFTFLKSVILFSFCPQSICAVSCPGNL